MKQFSTICIEIGSKCNRKCKFCPNAYFERPNELMSEDVLCTILNQLNQYTGRIELYIYNEPMLHPDIHGIIEAVRANCPRACIMIATNGLNICTKNAIKLLYKSGLNQLQINCYDSEEQFNLYQELINFIPWIDQTKSIYLGASSKSQICCVTNKSDMRSIVGTTKLSNRSGLTKEFIESTDKPLQKMCVKPFRLLNINWKGDAIICCNDYFGNVTPGNVLNKALDELWNSELFNIYRKTLLQRNRDLPLCKDCDSFAGVYVGNIVPADPIENFLEKQKKLRSLDYEHRSCHLAY